MITALKLPTGFNNTKVAVACLLLGYLLIWIFLLHDYLPPTSLSFLLGIMALPFTIDKRQAPGSLVGCAAMTIVTVILAFLVPVKTFLFFSIGLALFLLCNSYYGTMGFLSYGTLVLMAPVLQYVLNVFGFPIRLQLTAWAVHLLAFTTPGITTQGNMINYKGAQFSVDPACMGLNMLITSLLLGIMLIGYHQKKCGKVLNWYASCGCLALIVVLNVLSNLIRILLLVQFNILPQNWLHDLTGFICVALYVGVPAAYMIKLVVQKAGVQKSQHAPVRKQSPALILGHGAVLLLVVLAAMGVAKRDTYSRFQLRDAPIAGYQVSQFAPGIVKLQADQSLIYVKYVRGFYDTDHNPTICWKGSGYELQQVQKERIHQHDLYTAELVNGAEKLYTAWWCSNGQDVNTTDQLTWRWHMIKDKKQYAVINVTAASEKDLYKEVEKVLHRNLLASLFFLT